MNITDDAAVDALLDIFCIAASEPIRYQFILPIVEKALKELDLLDIAIKCYNETMEDVDAN